MELFPWNRSLVSDFRHLLSAFLNKEEIQKNRHPHTHTQTHLHAYPPMTIFHNQPTRNFSACHFKTNEKKRKRLSCEVFQWIVKREKYCGEKKIIDFSLEICVVIRTNGAPLTQWLLTVWSKIGYKINAWIFFFLLFYSRKMKESEEGKKQWKFETKYHQFFQLYVNTSLICSIKFLCQIKAILGRCGFFPLSKLKYNHSQGINIYI